MDDQTPIAPTPTTAATPTTTSPTGLAEKPASATNVPAVETAASPMTTTSASHLADAGADMPTAPGSVSEPMPTPSPAVQSPTMSDASDATASTGQPSPDFTVHQAPAYTGSEKEAQPREPQAPVPEVSQPAATPTPKKQSSVMPIVWLAIFVMLILAGLAIFVYMR
jgi:cobalamin biosynthesis Mg chelatase CobN